MKQIISIYLILQLLSSAFGLIIIDTVKPLMLKKIDNYKKLKEKYSNRYNENISIIKTLIPFYYAKKAFNLLKDNNQLNSIIKKYQAKQNESNNYEEKNDNYKSIFHIDETLSKYIDDPTIKFVKPEPYKAQKNTKTIQDADVESLKNQFEVSKEDNVIDINPYLEESDKKLIVKEDININKEISKAICNLNYNELKELRSKIEELEKFKKEEPILILKDIA